MMTVVKTRNMLLGVVNKKESAYQHSCVCCVHRYFDSRYIRSFDQLKVQKVVRTGSECNRPSVVLIRGLWY